MTAILPSDLQFLTAFGKYSKAHVFKLVYNVEITVLLLTVYLVDFNVFMLRLIYLMIL